MSYPNAIEVCRAELFTPTEELRGRYPENIIDKLMRVREMYNWFLANPGATDKEFVAEVVQRFKIHRTTAYSDLNVVKSLLPMLGSSSRDFHRWRTNEMLIATYRMAEKRKDTKTMEKAASAYGKLNRIDLEDEQAMPYDLIVPQPFTATDDPRVLGIKPIPNIQAKIDALIEKYRKETIDIEDVDFEEVDLEIEDLFPDKTKEDSDVGKESIL